MNAISIQIMLHEFKISDEKAFIRYIRSSGKDAGTLKTGYYLFGNYQEGQKDSDTENKPAVSSRKLMKHSALLPVWNVESRQRETLFIPNIIGYNNYIVKH